MLEAVHDDSLIAALRGRRRGRPPATPGLETLAVPLRCLYDLKRREFSQGRARKQGEQEPSKLAFAWMVERFRIGRRRLRQVLFSKATGAAYRALQAERAAPPTTLVRPRP
jgi:hypothetical protein